MTEERAADRRLITPHENSSMNLQSAATSCSDPERKVSRIVMEILIIAMQRGKMVKPEEKPTETL